MIRSYPPAVHTLQPFISSQQVKSGPTSLGLLRCAVRAPYVHRQTSLSALLGPLKRAAKSP